MMNLYDERGYRLPIAKVRLPAGTWRVIRGRWHDGEWVSFEKWRLKRVG